MSAQPIQRRQLYTSCAILAIPLALAGMAAHAQTTSSTAGVLRTSTVGTAATGANSTVTVAAAASTVTTGKTAAATTTTASTGATAKPATTTTVSSSTTPTVKPASTGTATTSAAPVTAYSNTSKFGNFLRPFAANSLWNARPVNPKFGTFAIPTSDYYPVVGSGAYSAGVFEGLPTDPPMEIVGPAGSKGLWNADAEEYVPSITVPHFPTTTTPSTSGDGHADIIDSATGIVHSFWQLKQVNGKWQAHTYGWTRVDGSGWGDPARYYQGARAAAVPPLAGLIRKHEIDDGADSFSHALSMSLTFNALGGKPTYVYPATSADTYAASLNSGQIPEGSLVMLPPSFDVSKLTSPKLRKVANTLKKYGAYVVDQNAGTPYFIYVENNSGYCMHCMPWNSVVAAELQQVRAALRQVVAADGWLDGDGKAMVPQTKFNLLSMRGPWTRVSGTGTGKFNTYSQAVEFGPTTAATTLTNGTGRGLAGVTWAKTEPGTTMKLTAITTGGGKFRAQVYGGSKVAFDTGLMENGATARFVLPTGGWYVFYAISGVGASSTVRATLETVTP
ncbi:Atrophin-1 multi-domain protein [Oxalobacteraceae bacterium OTU3CINTB1]|nr:Atrophin-1 multi-domain protein [Oxalobacteraceae bacterium OTU3CINTB1]